MRVPVQHALTQVPGWRSGLEFVIRYPDEDIDNKPPRQKILTFAPGDTNPLNYRADIDRSTCYRNTIRHHFSPDCRGV
ncbi:MAG: hypothetical protein HRT77_07325 [Halioglobus sp.]|nr:hypothetical protein [Halioglobus sp.]